MKDFTKIAQFNNSLQANLLKAQLEKEGIQVELLSSDLATVLPISEFTHDIYVPLVNLTKSRKILKVFISSNVESTEKSKLFSIKTIILILMLIFILGLGITSGLKYYQG